MTWIFKNNMEKEFLSYEQALALKELGFDFEDYDILGFYSKKYGVTTHSQLTKNDGYNPAIIYQQAFRWFREKYELHSTITSISQESWQWHITKPGESLGKLYDEDFYTYEEAELACLKKLIEITKRKIT